MRFLLDQNLSPRLLADLAALYPGSTHVRDQIAAILRREHEAILAFEADAEGAFLALG